MTTAKLKIKKNRKAFLIGLKAFVLIVLVLFGLFIAYTFFIPKSKSTVEQVDRYLCRTSVKAKAETKILKTPSPVNLECYTRFATIEPSKKYEYEKKDNRIRKGVSSKEELREAYADELGGCFWQMGGENGESLYNPFSPFESTGQARCVICSTIDIDEEIIKKYGGTIDKFNSHLRSHNYKDVGIDVPYSRLLGLQNKEFPDFRIERNNKPMSYSVVWIISSTPAKTRTTVYTVGLGILGAGGGYAAGCLAGSVMMPIPPFSLLGCVVGAGAGGAAGAGVGYGAGVIHTLAEDQTYSTNTLIIPADEAEKHCAQLY
ncbi:hypothetical protein GF371_00390 [Candidatus Woesearchaeota archaeon]|nr:hypothetical protein [Candidatus Woesearchaeota archaeon]